MPQKKLSSASLLALSVISGSAMADLTKQVEDALNFYHYGKNGAVKIDLNYRYENVDQDRGPQKTANANTVRLRAGLLSPTFYGFQGYAEYEGNLAMQEDFNSTRNGNTAYSTVADPEKSELNQLWISYDGIPDTVIKGGRQRIKLDDDRFIGNVGWRQMETTFDSVLVTHNNQQLFGLTINAGYIGNVQTFTATNEHIEAPILNISYKVGDYGNLIAYGYWLDYTERENYEKSSQTYGLRMSNFKKPGDSLKLSDNYGVVYTAEWAYQEDYGHGATRYDASRINLMGGITAYNFTFQGAVEQLDGKGLNKTFDTPLGTNHAFQGWADLFLITPKDGIRDVSGAVHTVLDRGDVVLTGVYHDFTDDSGSLHYGKEWDFQATKKFGKHYSLLAKYAYYDADQFGTDTQRIWVQGNISF
ncbi:MAG: alginate export family protein [Methylobacter sp.]|nr:alginate export family protein [Methylobacter sp.]MDP2428765.1 alginate export family protein [Methylobacter sp.]MDP3056095.1 alginate export family protein [Methylobacter sp.]MDP3362469.1 alginate export family protein [Methylobacter sp.]MDZ4219354.1 alginate export family protein [Methylobacter sp.]